MRIEQEDAIADLYAPRYVSWCYDGVVNPDFSPSQEFCGYFSRDPASGEIVDLQDLKRNLGTVEVSGIDAQVDWRVAVGSGEARLNLLASWMDRFEMRQTRGVPTTEQVGFVGGLFDGSSYPEWKLNLNLGYLWRDLDTNLQWRYVDGMRSRDFPTAPRIPGYDILDLYARYEVGSGILTGLTLRVGIENLTDEEPPVFAGSVQANTDPSQYDVLGRRYFASLSYRF